MELKKNECQHKKTVEQILQADGYLVIATKDGKVCLSYVNKGELVAGIATAIRVDGSIRLMLFDALLRLEQGERHN